MKNCENIICPFEIPHKQQFFIVQPNVLCIDYISVKSFQLSSSQHQQLLLVHDILVHMDRGAALPAYLCMGIVISDAPFFIVLERMWSCKLMLVVSHTTECFI